jgi:hypothetical protein
MQTWDWTSTGQTILSLWTGFPNTAPKYEQKRTNLDQQMPITSTGGMHIRATYFFGI